MEDLDLTADRFLRLWDQNNSDNDPWMQQEGEKDLWYSRFKDFLLQGSSRSVLQAVQKWRREKGSNEINAIPNSWTLAKRRHDWLDRASLFDQAVQDITDNLWAERQAEMVAFGWEASKKLKKRFEKMLEFPLKIVTTDTKSKDGKTINRTIIRPANWNQNTMIKMAEVAIELGRMAVGMPTEHGVLEDELEEIRKIYIPSNSREKGVDVKSNADIEKEEITENGDSTST